MSDNNMYNILGKMSNLNPKLEEVNIDTPKEPVYEEVDSKGSIMEGVRQLEQKLMEKWDTETKTPDSKKGMFKGKTKAELKSQLSKLKASGPHKKGSAEYTKEKELNFAIRAKSGWGKVDETFKPDFLDLDDDGDYDEPMKSAAKDAEKPSAPNKAAILKRKHLQAIKDKQEDERMAHGSDGKSSNVKVHKGTYGSEYNDETNDHDLDEVAPPGAKAERMVKHIKKGYSKDGKLTPKEKSIAYATAWKAHNKGQVEEGVEFNDTIKNSTPGQKDMKLQQVKEGKEAIRNHPIYTDKEAWDHYKAELDEQELMDSMASDPYVPYDHANQELDEIAKLAGLTNEMDSIVPADSESPLSLAQSEAEKCPVCDMTPCACDHEHEHDMDEDMMAGVDSTLEEDMCDECGMMESQCACNEGNEFSGALANARNSGEKEFEVGGKRYSVREAEELNSMRRLAGLSELKFNEVDKEPIAEVSANVQRTNPRDIEHLNTPRERVAGTDAAIPSGNDLNRSKRQDPKTANKAANPLTKQVEESLWNKYETIIKNFKA